MKSIYAIVIFLFLLCQGYAQTSKPFYKKQVQKDLDYLHTSLEEAHYNLFAYTDRATFDSAYRAIKASVKDDSLSQLEANKTFQRLVSEVKNGHTSINLPVQSYGQYVGNGGTLFPLELAFEGDKALIRKNWSGNEDIKIGEEVLSINGQAIDDILMEMYPQVPAERNYFKKAKIEHISFPRYYWIVFGQQDSFDVKVRQGSTDTTFRLAAIKAIEDYEQKRSEIITYEMRLDFYGNTAYLNPGGFGGDEEKYRQFIDSCFTQIKSQNTKNLIIDLRNNPGGNDSFSDYLVSYIAEKPFKWNSSFSLKTSNVLKEHTRAKSDTTTAYSKSILSHKDGKIYDYNFEEYHPQPKEKRFEGNVYVLVNRQSHSQSAVTAAQIQDYKLGTIVGEETAEYPSLYASIFQCTLPNTGIVVNISKGYIIRVNGSKKPEGVIPDIFIKDYLLDEKDEILEGLLERIEEE